ncbi:RsmD family RNA methyltransferase [Candidatus Mesenet endosymbiont of Agriotes lineatus]|uniref:RsmD family RNA methyltransferase n=1 Tax=Candidatus Mesenet endosymbiont of Agriotes lineatus TaxID=3077948 RepID=UPI0030CE149E
MLRIISGKYSSRKIETDESLGARPTMAQVRKAIFAILAYRKSLTGSNVLDLFCGSGSLSFEALSLGAKHSFMVDLNYNNLQLIKRTAENLKITDNVTLICCSADRLPKAVARCDFAFITPPYNSSFVEPTLAGLVNSDWLTDGALIMLEISKNEEFQLDKNYNIMLKRVYGTAKIILLSKNSSAS